MIKAMILAAGLGTRLRPLTDTKPKALVTAGGKSLLEINILKIISAGIRDIVINTHHFSEQIIYFLEKNNYFGVNIACTVEDELLDSGGGIKNARFFLEDAECFLVHNVDIISDVDIKRLISRHQLEKPLATLAVSSRKTSRYLIFDEMNKLAGWENLITGEKKGVFITKPVYKMMAFSGIHVISTEIFNYFTELKIFSIIDTYIDLCARYSIKGFEHDQDNWFDAGKPEGLLNAERFLNGGNGQTDSN